MKKLFTITVLIIFIGAIAAHANDRWLPYETTKYIQYIGKEMHFTLKQTDTKKVAGKDVGFTVLFTNTDKQFALIMDTDHRGNIMSVGLGWMGHDNIQDPLVCKWLGATYTTLNGGNDNIETFAKYMAVYLYDIKSLQMYICDHVVTQILLKQDNTATIVMKVRD